MEFHILPQTPNGKETRTLKMAKIKTSMSRKPRRQLFPRRCPKIRPRLDSILHGRDRNIAENYDNVNTIPTQHILAQSYIWATVSVIIYCSSFVIQKITAFMSENVYMKKIGFSYAQKFVWKIINRIKWKKRGPRTTWNYSRQNQYSNKT